METRPGSRHTGIIVDSPKYGGKRFLHLAWHYNFLNDPVDPTYSTYSSDSFSEVERQYLAERIIRRWEKNENTVAYGLDYDGAPAFDGADFFDGSDGRGLTCATFVLDFLQSCGFQICDLKSWHFRPEDLKFQRFISDTLASRLDGAKHKAQLERVEESVGKAARFRPEEVVACFNRFEDMPISMPLAQFWGYEVLSESNMLIL